MQTLEQILEQTLRSHGTNVPSWLTAITSSSSAAGAAPVMSGGAAAKAAAAAGAAPVMSGGASAGAAASASGSASVSLKWKINDSTRCNCPTTLCDCSDDEEKDECGHDWCTGKPNTYREVCEKSADNATITLTVDPDTDTVCIQVYYSTIPDCYNEDRTDEILKDITMTNTSGPELRRIKRLLELPIMCKAPISFMIHGEELLDYERYKGEDIPIRALKAAETRAMCSLSRFIELFLALKEGDLLGTLGTEMQKFLA